MLFRETYKRLAAVGACDEPGGVEYHRVRQEWIAAGRPKDIEEFIRRRANIAPTDPSETPPKED